MSWPDVFIELLAIFQLMFKWWATIIDSHLMDTRHWSFGPHPGIWVSQTVVRHEQRDGARVEICRKPGKIMNVGSEALLSDINNPSLVPAPIGHWLTCLALYSAESFSPLIEFPGLGINTHSATITTTIAHSLLLQNKMLEPEAVVMWLTKAELWLIDCPK